MRSLDIPLPESWPRFVRVAILHVMALARFVLAHRSSTAGSGASPCPRCVELEQELCFLREELRIKDARMTSIPPRKRPDYSAEGRMDILSLKASRGWSIVQTARTFHVCDATIRKWNQRVETDGDEAFVSAGPPVNKFPDLMAVLVQRLKRLFPSFGKGSIASYFARAGLHLGVSTVGRMLKRRSANPDTTVEPTAPAPTEAKSKPQTATPTKPRIVTAKHPNHLWHVDLTVLPIGGGFFTTWLPFSLPQRWPFCWWVVGVEDHFARRALSTVEFGHEPDAEEVTAVLDRAARDAKAYPKHLVCDQGPQFTSDHFEAWAETNDVEVRHGAIGQHGSIAVIERFFKTLKYVWLMFGCVSRDRKAIRDRLERCRIWHNQFRPHEALGGATPDEVYFGKAKANEKPRYEPRVRWPKSSPCAKPQAPPKRKPGGKLELDVRFFHNDPALPIVRLRRVA